MTQQRRRNGYSRVPPTDEGVQCLICGDVFRQLWSHLPVHGLSIKEYCKRFPDAETFNSDWSAIRRDIFVDRIGQSYWTRERVIASLQRWANRRGRTPMLREWEIGNRPTSSGWTKPRKDRPSAYTVRVVFGSWSAAIDAAGLPPARPWATKQYCKKGLHRWTSKNTVETSDGRVCRECRNEYMRAYRRKQVAAELG
jgi:hypothetical protein